MVPIKTGEKCFSPLENISGSSSNNKCIYTTSNKQSTKGSRSVASISKSTVSQTLLHTQQKYIKDNTKQNSLLPNPSV